MPWALRSDCAARLAPSDVDDRYVIVGLLTDALARTDRDGSTDPARVTRPFGRGSPVLLVMGLGTQMLGWPEGFCSALVDRGLHVIRFDNRDVGLSTHVHDAPPPDVTAALSGDASSATYTLSDMAADSVGLLDALDLDSAHIVGASMGGMIAQTIAIEHPKRVRSLTSIISSTGDPVVGQPTPEALKAVLSPPATSREGAIDSCISSG